MSLLVEALSNSKNNSNIVNNNTHNGRVKIQESTNELFKYVKYVTGFCKKKQKLGKKARKKS